jgi:S1-C subfamily serine protease
MKPQITGTTAGTQRRAVITNVEEGTPAAAAGLKAKDVVLRINDREVNAVSELTRALWRMNAGDETRITCQRGGETVLLTVKLATRPDGKPLAEL